MQDFPSLFASKCHALLCQNYVKGRDWYDFVWYLGNKVTPNLMHLQKRLIQSNAWDAKKILTHNDLIRLLKNKIEQTDFDNAKKDILPFIQDSHSVALWSTNFFLQLLNERLPP